VAIALILQSAHDFTAEPDHWRFGGGATDTVLHPIVLVAMLLTIILMLGLPRRVALAAFLFSTFLIPLGQQILIGHLHVFVYRIVVAAGWIRMFAAHGSQVRKVLGGGWNTLDKLFVVFVACHVVAFSLLNPSVSAIVNQIGFVWDYIGGYFLLRYLVQNQDDVTRTIKWFACIVVILGICMVEEQVTGKNVFGLLGGVRLVSEVREGRIRSEAVFQHSILAGVFGATVMPLFIWLWKSGKARFLSVAGVVGAAVMALSSSGSTPLGAYAMACFGVCLWVIRKQTRLLRRTIGITLVALQLTMKAPVWALIQRVDTLSGSSSYHRYQLIDQFIKHWSQWWLIGTNSNASWGDFMFDTSNQYVMEGTTGGVIALVLFIYQISWCFGKLGLARRAAEARDRRRAWLPWLLGVALLTHVTAFLGIGYFDQTRVGWFALLAMISVVTSRQFLTEGQDPVTDGPKVHTESYAEAFFSGGSCWEPAKVRQA
jgi:hypothetical protein